MIIPFTHEDLEARRWPLVTIGLVVLNVICLIALSGAMSRHAERLNEIATRALAYRDAHPRLDASRCAPIADAPRTARGSHIAQSRRGASSDRIALPEPDDGDERLDTAWLAEERRAQQVAFDDLCKEVTDALADGPVSRFGYVPAKNDAITLLTYQFLHGGWVHLLSNMWFLWLCGCNLEDRWGRAVFVPFYVTAGIVAALVHKMFAPHSEIPLVGASGSIAGAMGAFLVTYARTRIRFFYVFFPVRWGTFAAPAYVMLPLWLMVEMMWGLIGGTGVAHWAHVGGFAYGAAVAFALRRTGLDAKLDRAQEEKVTRAQDPRILQAGDMITAGAAREATAILDRVASEQPRNIDVQLELLRAAKTLADPAREVAAYAKLIELYFDSGAPDTAADLFTEMHGVGLDRDLTRGWTLKVASHLAARALLVRADEAYRAAGQEGLIDVTAVRAALAHARVLQRMGKLDEAGALLAAARESPFSTAEIDALIDAEIAQLGSRLGS